MITIRVIQVKMLPFAEEETFSIFEYTYYHRKEVDCRGHVILAVTVRAEKVRLFSFNMMRTLFQTVSSVAFRC